MHRDLFKQTDHAVNRFQAPRQCLKHLLSIVLTLVVEDSNFAKYLADLPLSLAHQSEASEAAWKIA